MADATVYLRAQAVLRESDGHMVFLVEATCGPRVLSIDVIDPRDYEEDDG